MSAASKGRKRCKETNLVGGECRKLEGHFETHSFPPRPRPPVEGTDRTIGANDG